MKNITATWDQVKGLHKELERDNSIGCIRCNIVPTRHVGVWTLSPELCSELSLPIGSYSAYKLCDKCNRKVKRSANNPRSTILTEIEDQILERIRTGMPMLRIQE